ncbi:cation diffusion facilitator family transporter [Rhodotorula paludigena]|uniref:cation diffusion facilitator family transporter n=1 Tax=Rhodotorula paludigena TaxID=86838 RepID=UPI003170B1BC
MAAPLPADPLTSLRQRTPAADRTHSGHSHSHAHGGHGHGHSHGIEETAHLSSAFQSLRNPAHLDPGSRITLVGLVANVGLTAVKGAAGYILASSALLADAAHSGSDLVADVVTLVSYRVGKWEPSTRYPYGYGKFESLGSLVVSFLLIATAAGIGLHSYHHLLLSLATIPSIPPDLLASLDFLPHGHVHGPEASDAALSGGADGAAAVAETVDARAMYFAAFSILVKEWLYRATLRVAKQQHSNVLLANAYHHRSDSLGSLVALLAIGAARVGYPMLDPIGGLVVTGMIAKQGYDVGKDALKALVDQVGDEDVQPKVYDAIRSLSSANVEPWRDEQRGKGKARLLPSSSSAHDHDHDHDRAHDHADPSPASGTLPILAIPSIRLFASGPSLLIDILLVLPPSLSLAEASHIEQAVGRRVREVVGRERVREVVVRMRADGVDDAAGGSAADGAREGVEFAHDELVRTAAKGGKEQ